MTPTNNSNGLGYRLIVLFLAFLIAGFLLPPGTLNQDQLLLLWVLMPFVGWLWIQGYVAAVGENYNTVPSLSISA